MQRKMPLPRGWTRRVRSSVLHILTLSHGAVPASALSKAKTMWAGRAQGSGLRIIAQLTLYRSLAWAVMALMSMPRSRAGATRVVTTPWWSRFGRSSHPFTPRA